MMEDSLARSSAIKPIFFRAPPPKETTAAKALRLLDARRIRRDALKRNFDLLPDDDPEEEARLLASNTAAREQEPETSASSPSSSFSSSTRAGSATQHNNTKKPLLSSSSSSSTTPSAVTHDPLADFALFGRVIPHGVFRDRVRHYLIQSFPTLSLPVPVTVASTTSGTSANSPSNKPVATAAASDSKRSPSAASPANRLKQTIAQRVMRSGGGNSASRSATAAASAPPAGPITETGARRVFRANTHKKTGEELQMHRKLLDAARGELSADLASMCMGDSFRRLIRSTTDAEAKEAALLHARSKLPFCVTDSTLFSPGAFPDRPPSPRTLLLSARRARVAQLLAITSNYSSFLSLSTPSTLYWMMQYMLRAATLAPANSFFGMPAQGEEDDEDEEKEDDADTSSPLARRNSSATAAAGGEQAPRQHQPRSCAIIVAPHHLAANFKNALPWSVLDDSDVSTLMKYAAPHYQRAVEENREAAKRGMNPSLLITLAKQRRAAGNALDGDLERLLEKHLEDTKTVYVPREPVTLEAALLRLNRAVDDAAAAATGATGARQTPPLALLCYAALLPRAIRNSKALLAASASVPPPALTRELLAATAAEYDAFGGESNEKMAQMVRNYSSGFHIHITHVALGHDASLLYETAVAAHAAGESMHVVRKPPTPFSPALCALAGGERDCPICHLSGLESCYSYVDHTLLAPLREEARSNLCAVFEGQVLRSVCSAAGTPTLSRQQQQQALRKDAGRYNECSSNSNCSEGDSDSDRDVLSTLEKDETQKNSPRTTVRRGRGRKRQPKRGLSPSAAAARQQRQLRSLINTRWRAHIEEFEEDLRAFETVNNDERYQQRRPSSSKSRNSNKKKKGGAAVAAALKNRDESTMSMATLNDRYFDCFCAHLVLSPQFASCFASLMLKQIVEMTQQSK